MKKCVSIFLALVMVLSLVQAAVFSSTALSFENYGDYVLVKQDNDTYLVYAYKGTDTDISLPIMVNDNAVIGVYSSCFEKSDITSVVIPENYTIIGDSAFSDCKNLTSVTLPAILDTIGMFAFSGCEKLTSVDMSELTEIKELPYGVFANCSTLESVFLPVNLEKIGEYAFSNTAIESIVFPDSVKVLGDNCFESCQSLSLVELPFGLTDIQSGAFNNTSISSVYIPKSVKTIGEGIFGDNSVEVGVAQGSAADSYCAENGFTNVTRYVLGDANSDGTMNITDATYIQKYCANLRSFNSAAQKDVADVTGDGEVSVRDATLIQMRLAEIISSFD